MHWRKKLLVLAALAVPVAPLRAAVLDVTYTLGADGDWNTAGNWSGDAVPANNSTDQYNVTIGSPSPVNVSLDISPTINNLTVNATDQLTIDNNQTLVIAGSSIVNNGTILLNSGGNQTFLQISAAVVTLSGTGSLEMGANSQNAINGANSTQELINSSGHTISGGGRLGSNSLQISNAGTINANLNGVGMTVQPDGGGLSNTGTMEASNGGTLNFNQGTFTNTSGTIQALAGSTVSFNSGATISGGTLTTAGTGLIEVAPSIAATLENVTNTGSLQLSNNSVTTLSGTITNTGTVTQASVGNFTDAELSGSVTLTGAGTWNMGNNVNNRWYGGTEVEILTNKSTIQGAGQIGIGEMGLINQGTINANQSNTLSISTNSSGTTNTGTLEATSGGTLNVSNQVTNTGGTITAQTGSTVNLNSAQVTGGTLTTAGTGTLNSSNSSLANVTNTGTLTIPNNTVTTLSGTFTDNGTVVQNSVGNLTDAQISGNVLLTGTGTWTMSSNTNNRWYGVATTNILTNASGHTIEGSGNIGIGQMGLTNNGIINGNQSQALTIQPSSTGAINTGTLESTGSGTLNLSSGSFNNAGGTISALGTSTLNINSATITGGTLTSAAGATMNSSNSTLTNVTNTGTLSIPNNTDTTLVGTFTNNGSVQQLSGGNLTDTILSGSGAVTLNGSGAWTMSNNTNNRFYADNTSDSLVNNSTIQGAGQIGVGQTNITNTGVISATDSNTLTVDPGSTSTVTNTGTLQAAAGGNLRLQDGTFNSAGGGILLAQTGGLVQLGTGVVLTGGTLKAQGTGLFENTNNASLQNLTIDASATLQIDNNTDTTLTGTITNNGQVNQNSGGNLTNTHISGDVLLTGSGTWTMTNNTQNRIYGNTGAEILTIDTHQTLEGAGQLGVGQLNVVNKGVIDGNDSNFLTISPGGTDSGGNDTVTNTGTMEAGVNGHLALQNGAFNSTGGTLLAQNGGLVQFNDAAVIAGGTLLAQGTGSYELTGGVTLQGVTIDSSALVNIDNNTDNTLVGTITNNGQVNQNSGGNLTNVLLSGNVTINGTGTWTLSNNTNNRIYGDSGADVLTNGAGHTINGAGQLGAAQMGLDNFGTINATQNNALTIAPTGGMTVTNEASGTFEGSGSAGLQLTAGIYNNLGTVVALNGSNVTYSSNATTANNVSGVLTNGAWEAISTGSGATVTIQGNAITQIAANTTVELSGAGSVLQAVSTPLESTLTTNNGTLQVFNSRSYSNTNALTNGGTLQLGGGTLTAPTFINNPSSLLVGIGTVTPLISNIGGTVVAGDPGDAAHPTTSGTLVATNGIQGGAGGIQVNPGYTLDLHNATAASTTGNLSMNGDLNLGSQNIEVTSDYNNANFGVGNSFNNHANVTGTGQILASPAVTQFLSGSAVTGSTTATPTLAFNDVHVGTTTTLDYQINTDPTAGGPGLRGAIQTNVNGGNITDTRLSGAGVTASNWGVSAPITNGNPTPNLGVTFTASGDGTLTGQTVHIANNFDNVAAQTLAITGIAYNLASPTVTPTTTTTALPVHVNATVSQVITVRNTAPNDTFSENLDVTVGTPTGNGQVNSTTPFTVAPGGSNATTVLSLNTSTAGNKTGTVTFGLTSDGTNIDTLGTTPLTSQSATLSTTVWNLASVGLPTSPITIGSGEFHVGDTATAFVPITNTALNDGFSEKLDAQVTGSSGNVNLATGSFTLLAAQATNSTDIEVGLDTSSSGLKTGTITIAFQSDGTGTSGLPTTSLGSQSPTVTANVTTAAVYALANPVITNVTSPLSIHLTDVHVGGTAQTAIAVQNNVPNNGFSENLDSTLKSTTGNVASTGASSFSLLAPGSTNSTYQLTIDTSQAGNRSGTADLGFVSDPTGVSGDTMAPTTLADQTVATDVNVYRLAAPVTVTNTTINLGVVHTNQTVTTGVVVKNNTTNDGFSEALDATAGGQTGAATALGSFTGVTAGASSSSTGGISVGLNTSATGSQSGTATFNFTSDGTNIDSLGTTNLTGQSITYTVNATVNNYASVALAKTSGDGSLSSTGAHSFELNLGTINPGSLTAHLSLGNGATGPADTLSGTWSLGTGVFGLTGFNAFSGLAAGSTLPSDLIVSLAASLTPGTYDQFVTLMPSSDNTSSNTPLTDITIDLHGTVLGTTPIPEPSTVALLLVPTGLLLLRRRRRRQVADIKLSLTLPDENA